MTTQPKHKATMNKNITAYEWGHHAGLHLADLGLFGQALLGHHRPLLPRQKKEFERGFREGVRAARATLYGQEVELGPGVLQQQQPDGTWREVAKVKSATYSRHRIN